MLGLSSYLLPFALIPAAFSQPVKLAANSTHLPTIDLGYELHQASSYDAATDSYIFSDIRYGQNPIGDLRFRAPLAPLTNRTAVQKGNEYRACPQGSPTWQSAALEVIGAYTAGKPYSLASWEEDIANATNPNWNWRANNTEDCLFLDVHVPRKVWETAQEDKGSKGNASVLAWIHGGGFVLGSKTGTPFTNYVPTGLLNHGQVEDKSGMIYVGLNYRLGAFGFLSGAEVEEDGVANAGLLDQRLALEWIQEKISLFGGSPDRVTVLGESGGAGSIMLQTMAYGGEKGPAPFSQGIAQSPAFLATLTNPKSAVEAFKSELNVTTINQIRKLSTDAVMQANYDIITAAPPSAYLFGPAIDGTFLPASPQTLYETGKFDKSVTILNALDAFEGGFFYDPTVNTEEEFLHWVSITVPSISPKAINRTAKAIYPPVFDGSMGYIDYPSRMIALSADLLFECNAELINKYTPSSYSYEFSVTPGVHTQDLSYTFNSPLAPNLPAPDAQAALQEAITSFAAKGTPSTYANGKASPFPRWDASRRVINITESGTSTGRRATNATRCSWWLNGALKA